MRKRGKRETEGLEGERKGKREHKREREGDKARERGG